MVAPAVGGVVLIRFPFSDLSASKLRPAWWWPHIGKRRLDLRTNYKRSLNFCDHTGCDVAEAPAREAIVLHLESLRKHGDPSRTVDDRRLD